MDRKKAKSQKKSQTFSSTPIISQSSSSPDFEFAVSLSPKKSSAGFCPADELFYKGKLLPLHPSRRLSMVQTIILSSSSSSSYDSAASRDSSVSRSSNESASARSSFSSGETNFIYSGNSARSSSVVGDDEIKRISKKPRFCLSKLSSVFKKEPKQDGKTKTRSSEKNGKGSAGSAKEIICRYLKKVKPFYEKLKQSEHGGRKDSDRKKGYNMSHSFSGNLVYTKRKTTTVSCLSSPSHNHHRRNENRRHVKSFSEVPITSSSMEELQNSIQGAILHCKNSMKIDG